MTTVLDYKMNYILNPINHVWKHPRVIWFINSKIFHFSLSRAYTHKLNIKLKDNDCTICCSMSPLLNIFSPGGTSIIVYVAFLSRMDRRECTCSCRNLNKYVYTHTCGGVRTPPMYHPQEHHTPSWRYHPSLTWNVLIRLDLVASKSQDSSCLCPQRYWDDECFDMGSGDETHMCRTSISLT